MSKRTEEDNDGLLKTKLADQHDEGDFAEPKQTRDPDNVERFSENEIDNLKVPDHLNICQWVIIGFLYLILAFLVGFIIYISATWNKDLTNEYT